MQRRHVPARCLWITAAMLAALAACAAPGPPDSATATEAFGRVAALQGDWVAADAGAGAPVVATYRVTGAGSAVIETLFPGAQEEMVSVYVRDGGDLLLTHDCSAGNQPRLRARRAGAGALEFGFDGGTNVDPSRDMHMHSLRLQLVSADEIRADWQGWDKGRADPAHVAHLHLLRKPG